MQQFLPFAKNGSNVSSAISAGFTGLAMTGLMITALFFMSFNKGEGTDEPTTFWTKLKTAQANLIATQKDSIDEANLLTSATATVGFSDSDASCVKPIIAQVEVIGETKCGKSNGQLVIYVQDLSLINSAYSVSFTRENGMQDYVVNGYTQNPIVINDIELVVGNYSNFVVTRVADNCSSTIHSETYLLPHGCEEEFAEKMFCGNSTCLLYTSPSPRDS